MTKLTKTLLVANAAARCRIPKELAGDVVAAIMEEIGATLTAGGKVQLIGFGTWKVAHRKERKGRHPRTGETLVIPARRVAVFRPGKSLKERVNVKVTEPV